MRKNLFIVYFIAFLTFPLTLLAEDGSRLWLRYDPVSNEALRALYSKSVTEFIVYGDSPVSISAREELQRGLNGLLGREVAYSGGKVKSGTIIAGTPDKSPLIASALNQAELKSMPEGGYKIVTYSKGKKRYYIIASATDAGVLYGSFHFLRLLQTGQSIDNINITSYPKTQIRILNHWDNLNRSVERGYAGLSLWEWDSLPGKISQRYTDYARANASIGINATVLTNVNANALILTEDYLRKVAVLAGVFRKYNIKVYLTARFSAPIEAGGLKTADPLDPSVAEWWKNKTKEIYKLIPDFGGFLVKANSEGQPGPQNYNRTHADGANMLADAVAPFGGIVMWRAFVYDNNVPVDRAMQASNEFVPLDGQFRENVIIQVKNGAIDFQPREPFHPLFGAMKKTSVMPELQITQEYLGSSTHLVYLGPLFTECLSADTYVNGAGSTVSKIITGNVYRYKYTAMAGVANAGSVTNWTGHPIAQSNWFAFGRLAWDPDASAADIADEWIRLTFSNDNNTVESIKAIMMGSRETAVNYMTPLGLHHIMYEGHHYGPGPWVNRGRADWTSVYYHRADSNGIGFDRTSKGSNAVGQYSEVVRNRFNSLETCPEEYLLWFNHLPWDYKMKSGRTLWEELCYRYDKGVKEVEIMQKNWNLLSGKIDTERFELVKSLLVKQLRDAAIWRDGCILYFSDVSGLPLPKGITQPANNLDYYKNHTYTDIPGITRGL